VCWRFGAFGFEWCPCCRLKHRCVGDLVRLGLSSVCVAGWSFSLQQDTTQIQPHQTSNTQRTENKTTDLVIQQNSRKLLMMDILMSETCWAHKKWNKIASGIKLVFYSSTTTMMHGPINSRYRHSGPCWDFNRDTEICIQQDCEQLYETCVQALQLSDIVRTPAR